MIADASITSADLDRSVATGSDADFIALKIGIQNNLAIYNLKDGIVDRYNDDTGVDASGSTNEIRDSSGKYYHSTVIGSYVINAFTSTGASTWTCPANTTSAEVLTVAGGGGGGGAHAGGGGGAGGIVHDEDYVVVPTTVYDLTVGAGGSGGSWTQGVNGSNSVWNVNAEGNGITHTAVGGGGGGSGLAGSDGGSGGGGGGEKAKGDSTQADFAGATSYGYDGAGGVNNDNNSAHGGGGAGELGDTNFASSGKKGGYGGDGVLFSSFVAYGTDSNNVASTGSNGGYFGGGGGGASGTQSDTCARGLGGYGGGGHGVQMQDPTIANVDALANTGGGGGGGNWQAGISTYVVGTDGGSGIVLIRSRPEAYNNLTLVSNAQTAVAAPTTGRLVIFEEASTGTTTLDIDIKGWVSRDNGTNYDQVALTSEGEYVTGKRILSGSVDFTMTASTNMRYKITTHNQSSTKITRVHGASMLWS